MAKTSAPKPSKKTAQPVATAKAGIDKTMALGPRTLWGVSCAPQCGFFARTHDKEELGQWAIMHGKKHHGRDFTKADVLAMMRVVTPPA